MKYTNIKKLLIKFMGGGLINFPTRFLRWVKINGDVEGDDSGNGGDDSEDNGYMFFGPATIQPQKYFAISEESPEETSDVKYVKDLNYNLLNEYFENDIDVILIYTKEELTKLGISLSELEQLEPYDILSDTVADYIEVNEDIFENNFIIDYIQIRRDADADNFTEIDIQKHRKMTKYIIRYNINGDDNIYMIERSVPGGGAPVG